MSIDKSLAPAPVERPTTVYLNDEEWLTVQTTPVDLRDWAPGYLFGEGVIERPDDLIRVVADEDRGLVWADLRDPSRPRPERIQRGAEPFPPITHSLRITDAQALTWMQQMLDAATLYHETGGMHVAAAVRADTGEQIIREDIGRHNAVDKVIGACLKAGWPADQVVMLTSGRISYEMCNRLARFGCGIAISRTAATDQAYYLAFRLGIELVGYARSDDSLTIYTEGKRIDRRGIPWSSTAATSCA